MCGACQFVAVGLSLVSAGLYVFQGGRAGEREGGREGGREGAAALLC
jgi:hypothetical protein